MLNVNVMLKLKEGRGFTLTEVLITLVIISILSAIAVPMYTSQVKKAYRSDAKSALVQLASAMERFRTVNNTYVGTTAVPTGGAPLSSVFPSIVPLDAAAGKEMYNLTISDLDVLTYTLTATPIAGRRMDEGSGNGVFTLEANGIKTYTKNGTVQRNWDD
jgi:type IV pilus assembly protein PilE